MGYITTFSIYNDHVDLVKKHSEEFAKIIYEGSLGVHTRNGVNSSQVGLGNHCNLITIQSPRHANNSAVFVHYGNSVSNIDELENTDDVEFVEAVYHIVKRKFDQLKEKRKNLKNKK